MDVQEAIRQRRSVRAYQLRPLEEDKLMAVLEAGRLAPSGNNRQPWRFVVVRDPEVRQKLVPACHDQKFVGQASVVIAAVGLTPERIMGCQTAGDAVDVTIAVDHMALAAVELGLGTCWIGAFDQDAVRAVLGIPPSAKVVIVLTLGYPADGPKPKSRKPAQEVFCWDRWK